jgi:hypothetical protein
MVLLFLQNDRIRITLIIFTIGTFTIVPFEMAFQLQKKVFFIYVLFATQNYFYGLLNYHFLIE